MGWERSASPDSAKSPLASMTASLATIPSQPFSSLTPRSSRRAQLRTERSEHPHPHRIATRQKTRQKTRPRPRFLASKVSTPFPERRARCPSPHPHTACCRDNHNPACAASAFSPPLMNRCASEQQNTRILSASLLPHFRRSPPISYPPNQSHARGTD
jgi:hypothetical protein